MDELIPVGKNSINGQSVQTVDSRDLHEFLKVDTRHDVWISRRIEEYVFSINSDFCTILDESTGGRPATIYYLSLDMAKEICMVERTPKGREARQYFIECERRLRDMDSYLVPKSPMELLAEATEAIRAEHRARIESLEERTGRIEANLDADHGYLTLLAFCKMNGLPTNDRILGKHGMALRKICLNRDIARGEISNARGGTVHTYPEWLLREYFDIAS